MTTALLTLAAILVAAPFALMALHWLLLSYSREQGAAVAGQAAMMERNAGT